MSALPNSTGSLAGLNTGVFVQEDSRGWEQAQRQYEAYRGRTAALRPEQLALGLTLLELRKKTPAGLWGARLKEYGIATHTSKRAIKAAGAHLGIGRVLMAEILCCSLAKLKAYGLPKSKQQPDPMGQVSHSPELDVGVEVKELPRMPCSSPAEIAALNRRYGITDEEDGVDVTVKAVAQGMVVAQGTGTVVAAPAAPQGDGPPVAQKAVAGRIGPAELGRARRPEVAGQMTLAPLFDDVYLDVQRMDQAGRGEKARAIVAEGLADIRRKLAELGEAPVGGA